MARRSIDRMQKRTIRETKTMKFNYLGYEILLTESTHYSVGGIEESPNYRVDANGQPIYLASSQFGNAYATDLQAALDGAYQIIEAYLMSLSPTGIA